MLPPLSPATPVPPSPSPSSNDGASSTAGDDDDEHNAEYVEDGNAVKFKLPKKGSALLSIFNYCKEEIFRRRMQNNHAELKDEDVDKDPIFLILMNEWKSHYETNVGEDRFFPVLIPQPVKKKRKPHPLLLPKKAPRRQ